MTVSIEDHVVKKAYYLLSASLSLSPAVTVEFDPTSYTVSESGRLANITVMKRGSTTQTVNVIFNTADNTARG